MKIRTFLTYGLICMALLSGCGQRQEADKPDLSGLGPIEVIAREDGSGTRTQFESLVDTEESGTKAIASSTEEVIDLVLKNPSAIGYVAMSALRDYTNGDADTSGEGLSQEKTEFSASSVKILSVGGVAPSEQTVRNHKYPLTRKYYLAWSGTQTDLEREFITFVRGAGQKYVAEEAVPVSKETSFLSMKPSGTLTIAGSTSMTPMMQKLTAAYQTYNPDADIKLESTDSTQGLTDAIQGKVDIAMSSRDLKDYEQELLTSQEIAADAIVIIVNPDNALTDISTSDLKQIFDGTTADWDSL